MLLFVAPVVILGLFYFLIRGGSESCRPSIWSTRIAGPWARSSRPTSRVSTQVTARPTSAARAASDLDCDAVAAYVVFPGDFSAAVTAEDVITPEVHLEGTEPGLTQPVLLALDQSITRAAQQLDQSAGGRAPVLEPTVDYLHGGPSLNTLDYFGAAFIGLVVFLLVFVVTIIAFLRERSQGTLERLMASPLRRADIVVGYMAGFMVVAAVQSVEVVLFTLYVLHVHNQGDLAVIVLITLLMTLVAVNLGMLLSMFATTEFQAVQFIPLAIVPQVLLSGIIFPVSSEPVWLQVLSKLLPLTYGVDGLRDVMLKGNGLTSGAVLLDIGVVAAFAVALVVAATTTLRRRVS